MSDDDNDKPRNIFSDELMQALENEVKKLIGEPAFRQIRETLDRNLKFPWKDVTDRPGETPAPTVEDIQAEASRIVFESRARRLVKEIEYRDGYRLLCERDKKDPQGRLYLQLECDRPDAYTKEMGVGRGGKSYLSEHMTDGEILRRALGLCLAYEEHEVREFFKWRGRAIFGPHVDPVALWEAADKLDVRE